MARVTKKRFTPEINRELAKLNVKDNIFNFLFIGMDWGIIALSMAFGIYFNNIPSYLLAIILIGSRMRALENLLHNGSHGMLFAHPKLNNCLTRLFCAYPIFLSFNLYKQSHMDHHRWLGDYEMDPDLIRYRKLGIDKMPFSKSKTVWTLIKIFGLVGIPKYVYGSIASTLLHRDRNNELLPRLIFLVAANGLFIYAMSVEIWIKFWLIPYFTTFQMIRFLAEISEHGGLYGRTDQEIGLARNNTDHLMSFFIYPHSDNYHLTHHLFPAIAHHKMRAAHQIMMQDEDYRKANMCHGYFVNGSKEVNTTFAQLSTG